MAELTFDTICNDLRQIIHASGIPRMQSRFGTSDVIQECGIQIWKKICEQSDSPRDFNFTFIRKIAIGHLCRLHRHNLAAKRSIKQEASQEEQSQIHAEIFVDASSCKHQQAMAMLDGLQHLTATQKEIIIRRFFEEETFESITSAMNLTMHFVRKQYFISLQTLQRFVEGHG